MKSTLLSVLGIAALIGSSAMAATPEKAPNSISQPVKKDHHQKHRKHARHIKTKSEDSQSKI